MRLAMRARRAGCSNACVEGVHGGTGESFDWALIPQGLPLPLVLSGGLHAGNVAPSHKDKCVPMRWTYRAAWSAPEGIKDAAKIAAFIKEVKNRLTYSYPDSTGHFGPYGGIYVAETLMGALEELRQPYVRYRHDPEFIAEFAYELKHYVGRPSPIYHAKRLSEHLGGAQIYLKREDLNHTGAHKINNTIGQALLAKRMGKKRVIAETGAGKHGVATATVAARSAWNAWSTWARRTSSASRPTCSA